MSNFERRLRQSPNYVPVMAAHHDYMPSMLTNSQEIVEQHPLAEMDPRVWGLTYFQMARIVAYASVAQLLAGEANRMSGRENGAQHVDTEARA